MIAPGVAVFAFGVTYLLDHDTRLGVTLIGYGLFTFLAGVGELENTDS